MVEEPVDRLETWRDDVDTLLLPTLHGAGELREPRGRWVEEGLNLMKVCCRRRWGARRSEPSCLLKAKPTVSTERSM